MGVFFIFSSSKKNEKKTKRKTQHGGIEKKRIDIKKKKPFSGGLNKSTNEMIYTVCITCSIRPNMYTKSK